MPLSQDTDTVSSASALDLINTCRTAGLISEEMQHEISIEINALNNVTSRIPESTLIALWKKISTTNANQGIGLKIGQIINPEAKGLLASWVSQTNSLREALEVFSQNISLMNPSENWKIKESEKTCSLILNIQQGKGYPSIAIERSMSAMVSWGRALSNHPLPIMEAQFTFACPPYLSMFVDVFGENLHFQCNQNSLIFDSNFLDLPVVSSNQFLKEIIETKARQALLDIENPISISEKVKALIMGALVNEDDISVDQVSKALAVSRQTLYRQLKQENTDFRSLHETVRKEQALKLLDEGLENINAISLSLGYKDTSSFYKAFKRWYGVSPKGYVSSHKTTINKS